MTSPKLIAVFLFFFFTFQTLRDTDIAQHKGLDLCNFDPKVGPLTPMLQQRVRRDSTLGEFKKQLAEEFGVAVEKIRLWAMTSRANKTIRPDTLIPDSDDSRSELDAALRREAKMRWFTG